MEKVKVHLQTYFTKTCDLLNGNVNFLVLCAQCFEVCTYMYAWMLILVYCMRCVCSLGFLSQAS